MKMYNCGSNHYSLIKCTSPHKSNKFWTQILSTYCGSNHQLLPMRQSLSFALLGFLSHFPSQPVIMPRAKNSTCFELQTCDAAAAMFLPLYLATTCHKNNHSLLHSTKHLAFEKHLASSCYLCFIMLTREGSEAHRNDRTNKEVLL